MEIREWIYVTMEIGKWIYVTMEIGSHNAEVGPGILIELGFGI